jgi:galactokinase/mevalonate kinase-like predicted kinase
MAVTITASAPGRCGIIGNPSDIYGGNVLSCSLPVRARCKLTIGVPDEHPDDMTLWNAVMKRFPIYRTKVEWSSGVPRSSGLAGSTALLAATLACVLKARQDYFDLITPGGLADFSELVRDVERYEAEVICGFQDAYMVVHGGLQLMDFKGKRPDTPGGPHAKMKACDSALPFLLVTTGVERLSGSVHGPMAQRWLNGERAVTQAMDWIGKAAPAGWEALQKGDGKLLAELMDENQRLIASVGGSGDAIDALVLACKQNGALSAKLAGAGMGGTVIALTPDPPDLEARLQAEGYTKFMQPRISEGLRFEH